MAIVQIPPSKNVGESVVDINNNFDYLNTHDADIMATMLGYADTRDAEILAAALDYTDDHIYTHPTYTATDINYTSGTQQITPGTQFTLPWFSVDNKGHVYRSGLGYYNITPYTHPSYSACDIGKETGITTLTPGATFTLPWVHVDTTGHVNQHGTSNYNIGHDDSKADADHTHKYAGSDSSGGAAASAVKLKTTRTIDGVSFDGSDAITHYGTCSTATATVAKIVACTGFTLVTGARVSVVFTNGNSADGITLNVNNTGAKPVYQFNAAMEYVKLKIYAGMVYDFIYNGSVYQCINDQRYTWQQDASDDKDYRMLLSTFDNDGSEIGYARKSKHFLANPSTGEFKAEKFSGTGAFSSSEYAKALTVNRTNTVDTGVVSAVDYLINGSRVGLIGFQKFADNTVKLHVRNAGNSDMMTVSGLGVAEASQFKNKSSGSLFVDTSANANSVSITNAEIAKYSTVYMSATWTERETVEFCDIIPIADIIAGAVFRKITETGTRRYTYSVTCTSAGLFTLTQSNSTGTSGTLRLKLYVI